MLHGTNVAGAALVLALAMSISAEEFDPWTESATYEVSYTIDLTELPAQQAVNLWVPLPVSDHNQQVVTSDQSPSTGNWRSRDIVDNRGNRIAEFVLPADPARVRELEFRYTIRRKPSSGLTGDHLGDYDDPTDFLGDARKIPLDGLIATIAREQKGTISSKNKLQRHYYDYIYDTMTYSKEGDGWGQGDAIWACQSRYGNCTDFHSLYIGLVRSQDIPARFKIGFPLSASERNGRHDGYHCWAEVYNDTKGWVPLDASEAKKAGRRDDYYGTIPSDRIEFTQGRDLVLSPRQRGMPINYFIYPYAESATTIIERLPVKLTYRRLDTSQV